MKLELETVGWQNFNSYGQMWTEIQLNRNPLTVIEGRTGDNKSNGAGKSTITDVLGFVLFDKPIRKNKKGRVVNRTNNKNCLGEVTFNVDGVINYKIRRGLKPEVFEIYENGELLPKPAKSADYQKMLESRILRMNFTTFTQSVVVSKTLYTPFMQLSKPQRRLYVEDVLRLKIFSNMAKLHADNLKRTKIEHNNIKNDYDRSEIEFKSLTESVEVLERVILASTQEKHDFINSKINEAETKINDYVAEHKSYKVQLVEVDNEIKNKYNSNLKVITRLKDKLADEKESLEKLDNSEKSCSMCGNELSAEHLESHKKVITDKIEKLVDGIKKVEDTISELEPQVKEIEQLEENNNKLQNEMSTIQRLLVTVNNEKKTLQAELSNITVDTSELDTTKEKLYNVSQEKQQKEIELNSITKQLEYCTLVATMLKDNGIKASIVEKSIPLINKLINQNLSRFGFFAKFELDNEFNETILLRGFQEASYYDFSEGEKLRIDMAILLAWREITMLQNAMFCNVLFLDEITDASLDDDGIAIFSNMLTNLKGNNVFVITHKPEKLENIARSRIIIEKVDGYSRIAKN